MKKILGSILMVTMAAGLIGLGTFAFFSDTETSQNYLASSGTIEIEADWPDQPAGENTLSDLKPSQVRYLTETVRNVGKNPAVIFKHTHVNSTSDEPVVDPERKEGTIISADGVATYVPRSDIDKVILYDLRVIVYNSDASIAPIEDVIIPEPDGTEAAPTLAQISSKWIRLGVLPPGGSMKVIQSYHMRKDTTNWAQDDSVNFNMDFKALQTNDDTTMHRLPTDTAGKPITGDPDFDLLLVRESPTKQSPGQTLSFFDVFFDIEVAPNPNQP